MTKNKSTELIIFLNIAVARAFLPITIIATIFLTSKIGSSNQTSELSFIFAAAQILAQIDGGSAAALTSHPARGNFNLLSTFILNYLRKYLPWKIALCTLCALFYATISTETNLINLLIAPLSVAFVVYNLFLTAFVKEKTWKKLWISIALSSALIVFAYSFFLSFGLEILPLIFSLLLALSSPVIFFSHKSSESYLVKTSKFQLSQIFISLILNKDYILTHLFQLTDSSVQIGLAGRVAMIGMQLIGLLVFRHWLQISNSCNLSIKEYSKKRNSLFILSILISLAILTPLSYFDQLDHRLALALIAFISTNSLSSIASAYASVDYQAIPGSSWFVCSSIVLFLASIFAYLTNTWWLSIIFSSLYFLYYAKTCTRKIRWA